MENIKVNIPEGYEIDEKKSVINLEKGVVDIKLKKKNKRWRDNKNTTVKGFYITSNSKIIDFIGYNIPSTYNTFATEKQAKSALAMARISQIMANDERFGGIITDEEWTNESSVKYIIVRNNETIYQCVSCTVYYFLAFHTKEQRDLFLEENEDLVKDYLMLD